MKRHNLLKKITSRIMRIQKDSPVLVGIDGPGAAGKTTLAADLAKSLKDLGREVITASIDDFHNPAKVRSLRGRDSAEGCYRDTYNYPLLKKILLDPLKTGNRVYQTAGFNFRTDSLVSSPIKKTGANSILIFEGIFLLRMEIIKYWDLKIFLEVDFKITLNRALARKEDLKTLKNKGTIREKYQRRYIPAQKIYFRKVKPQQKADVVIGQNDFENPIILKQ